MKLFINPPFAPVVFPNDFVNLFGDGPSFLHADLLSWTSTGFPLGDLFNLPGVWLNDYRINIALLLLLSKGIISFCLNGDLLRDKELGFYDID